MLGNTNTYNESSGYIGSIVLNDDVQESEYAAWTITVNESSSDEIICELSYNNKTLALNNKGDTNLEIPSSNKDMAKWELSPYPNNNYTFTPRKSAETTR